MKRAVERYVAEHGRIALLLGSALVLAASWLAGGAYRGYREGERLALLETEVERSAIAIMSQTLDSSIMGGLSLLGLIDSAIKDDARLGGSPGHPVNQPALLHVLESLARAHGAQGAFVVGTKGVVATSWDDSGKPSSGLDVSFRPYFKMAMLGSQNIYAAVSMARGDRALYYAAPIRLDDSNGSPTVGAVVGRSGLAEVDRLIRGRTDRSLLLSPQGVVFASSDESLVGRLAEEPSPERLATIRALRQFGALFDTGKPEALPFGVATGRVKADGRSWAVASAKVDWNDPSGPWKLVFMEDLSRSVPLSSGLVAAGSSALLLLALGFLLFFMIRGNHRQALATERVEDFARRQEGEASRKARLAASMLRLQKLRSAPELGQLFLEESHDLLASLQGTIYSSEPEREDRLRLIASYACAEAPPVEIASGEGLLGQCARERRSLALTASPGGFTSVRSGLGGAVPVAFFLEPLLLGERLVGIVELGFLTVPGEEQREMLGELCKLLAFGLESAERERHTTELLWNSELADRAKSEQLSFLQTLVDTIPYPVFTKGPDTRFLGINRAYEEAYGVKREEIIGKRVLELEAIPLEDRLHAQEEDEAIIATFGSVDREARVAFADGEFHDTRLRVTGFRDADGNPGGLVGTFVDIGAMKRAEQELARVEDLERFHRLALGRERRVLDLKAEANALAEALGRRPPYGEEALIEERAEKEAEVDSILLAPEPHEPQGLGELVDLPELQRLLVNFCEAIGVAAAIIDPAGTVLASARWQRVCTDFHRATPSSCARCVESDTELAARLTEGQDYTVYRCRNGMTDCASPIVVEGRHLANVFVGQFHLGPPNLDFFRSLARESGYPEDEYLAAVSEAPILVEARLPAILGLISGFARMIATLSFSQLRADEAQRALEAQTAVLRAERIAALSLAEDAERATRAAESACKENQE